MQPATRRDQFPDKNARRIGLPLRNAKDNMAASHDFELVATNLRLKTVTGEMAAEWPQRIESRAITEQAIAEFPICQNEKAQAPGSAVELGPLVQMRLE